MSINNAPIYDFGAWIDLAPEFDWDDLGDGSPSTPPFDPRVGSVTQPYIGEFTAGGSAQGGTAATLARPGDLATGDLLVVAARSQSTDSLEAWVVPEGFVLVSAPIVPSADYRMGGIWVKPILDINSEPAEYVFDSQNTGRRVAVAATLSVGGTAPVAVRDSVYDTPPISADMGAAPATTLDVAPALSLVAMGCEATEGVSGSPTTIPDGFAVIAEAQSTLDDSTTGSRTAIWLGWRAEPDTSVEALTGGYAGAAAASIYPSAIA